MRVIPLSLAPALAILGCADEMPDIEDMHGAIDAAQTENYRHHEATAMARSLGEVLTDLDRHEEAMGDIMAGMDESMYRMVGHCGGDGMREMDELRSDLGERLSLHRLVLEEATFLHEAAGECDRHYLAVDVILDQMHGAFGSMVCH